MISKIKNLLTVVVLLLYTQTVLANSYAPILKAHSVLTISGEWNLKGKKVTLPEGITLKFANGKISNGTLVGANTKISGRTIGVFDKVKISGTWSVLDIRTSMFVSLDYDNSLRDVFALTDSTIMNKVTIENGNYYFSLNDTQKNGITVNSKTDIIINGNLILKANSLRSYDIVKVIGTNVTITGSGSITGDLSSHIDNGGEWGMGIYLKKASNVSISGITIKDCWGDCIYVGGNSQKVLIDNCCLDHGRRQGVSVTYGSNVTLSNLKITNIGGTSPGYGIDIEPNSNGIVENVFIKNVTIDNSVGGILVYGRAKGAKIDNVIIEDCKISYTTKLPIDVRGCESVQIKGNILTEKL